MEEVPIYIIGAGPIGTSLAIMISAQQPVTVILKDDSRKVTNRMVLNLQVKELHSENVTIKTSLPSLNGIVFICVKAYDLDALAQAIRPRLGSKSTLVLTSNGLDLVSDVQKIIGDNIPILRLLPIYGARFIEENLVISGKLSAILGAALNDKNAKAELSAILNRSGMELLDSPSIAQAEWEKALINITINPIASILDRENGIILANPELKDLAIKLSAEVRFVAKSQGIDLSNVSEASLIQRISNSSSNINSTLLDIRAKRRTDIEFILGRMIGYGKASKIPTPIAETLYSILLAQRTRS